VPGFYLIAIITSHSKQSATVIWLIVLLSLRLDDQLRIVRGMTMSLREREFVPPHAIGCEHTRIIIRHICQCGVSSSSTPR